ncbi:hypothetical protein Lalb_Chr17g0335971 [Lupinus albus]|uniref:Uncharacterized protein n=1 Tax=Lupinus albus TaxID=3870 RepID=A0A6A4P685_LUPAL|nr:hypothetical protein Lalb_Chr17g0335971 [Lupinus albus]
MKTKIDANSFWTWNVNNKKTKEQDQFTITKLLGNKPEKTSIVLGPGFGAGIGCGGGIGLGLVGAFGIGNGWPPFNHLNFVFGFGMGCGLGLGYGFGQGIGYDFGFQTRKSRKLNNTNFSDSNKTIVFQL